MSLRTAFASSRTQEKSKGKSQKHHDKSRRPTVLPSLVIWSNSKYCGERSVNNTTARPPGLS